MKLEFFSYVDEEIIKKTLNFTKNKNLISLDDEFNTTFILLDNEVHCIRNKKIKQKLEFVKNKFTKTTYSDDLNFNLEFEIYTDELLITQKGIFIKYKLYADKKIISNHKIWLKFLEKSNEIN